MEEIHFYKTNERPFGAFSNFALYPVVIDGWEYRTSEHYYQSKKFEGLGLEDRVRRSKLCKQAWSLGNAYPDLLRSDWEQVKDNVMRTAIYAKFTQHPQLKDLLLSTGDAQLIEKTCRDLYWGEGSDKSGLNKLGLLLVELRSQLNGQKKPKLNLSHELGQHIRHCGVRQESLAKVTIDEGVLKESPVNLLRAVVHLSETNHWSLLGDDGMNLMKGYVQQNGKNELSPGRYMDVFKRSLKLSDPLEPYRYLRELGLDIPPAFCLLTCHEHPLFEAVFKRTKSPKAILALSLYKQLLNTAKLNRHGQILNPYHDGQVLLNQLCIEPNIKVFVKHFFRYVDKVLTYNSLSSNKKEQLFAKLYPDSFETERLSLLFVWAQILDYHKYE